MTAQHIPFFERFVTRLLVGAALGIAIGLERHWSGRSGGLHTSALVATGAALFASIEPTAAGQNSFRILANIVTGVGFLAGGVILRNGSTVTGLNTAATMWATAAVGALAGIALYFEAAAAAAVIIIVNILLSVMTRIAPTKTK